MLNENPPSVVFTGAEMMWCSVVFFKRVQKEATAPSLGALSQMVLRATNVHLSPKTQHLRRNRCSFPFADLASRDAASDGRETVPSSLSPYFDRSGWEFSRKRPILAHRRTVVTG